MKEFFGHQLSQWTCIAGNREVKFVRLKGGSDFVLFLFFCLSEGLLLLCCLTHSSAKHTSYLLLIFRVHISMKSAKRVRMISQDTYMACTKCLL